MELTAYADADHADTMADMNMPANDVPAEQAPAIAPPTRTDDQILPSSKWVPIGKSNCGITHRSNIDYAERIWEEFVQSIQTFLTNRKNLATASRGKKKTVHLLIPNDGREIFSMPLPDALLTDAIKSAPYYSSYLEHVTEYQRYLNKKHNKADDKSPEPALSQPPKQTPTPTESSKKDQDEGVPEKEPTHDNEEANLQRAVELSLKEQGERTQGPTRPVVIREPDSGRTQPLPERHTPMPTEPSEHADSPSIDVELALIDSEIESEEKVPVIKARDQDEGQARTNPGEQDKVKLDQTLVMLQKQMDEEFTTTAYLNVQENLKLLTEDQVILKEPASSTGTLSSLQNLDKDLSFTDQFFVEKPQEEEPGKTNAKAEVQSMVSVPIHQDTSSVPPMTTPVIDLIKSQSDSPLLTSTSTTSTITTLPPPPLQSTTDPILVRRIGELEQHIADLIQNNLDLEERLDKHDIGLYNWRILKIPTALQKSVELDYSNQCLADQEEARKKKRKRRESPRTPPGSPATQPPLPPLPAGASDAPGSSGASGSSQFPPPPPHPLSTSTSGFVQQQGSKAPSSSKTAALASQSMAWMTSDTQYKSADILGLKSYLELTI
ncbi:retrovirus-related pol polyprotein from transposon TNT 1-94 [Tanacetum coccineum]